MKPTVYIVQKPDQNKNILSAQRYGDFLFLLPNGSSLTWRPEETVKRIRSQLIGFNDEDPAAIGVCTAIAAEYNQGRVKFLKWDNREYQYYPVEVTI